MTHVVHFSCIHCISSGQILTIGPAKSKGISMFGNSVLLSVFCDPGKQQDTLSDKSRQGPDLALALFLKGEVRIVWKTQSNKEHFRQ